MNDPALPDEFMQYGSQDVNGEHELLVLRQRYNAAMQELSSEAIELLKAWPARKEGHPTEQYSYEVRGREITGDNYRESLSQATNSQDRHAPGPRAGVSCCRS